MAEPVIIDIHVHLYKERRHGLMDKVTYEVSEYGSKDDVRFSEYGGDLEDALKAINDSKATRAVVVNLCAPPLVIAQAMADLPEGLSDSQKEQERKNIDAGMAETLKASNRWVCEVAREHPQIVPYVCLDPWVLSGDDMHAHLLEMANHHGAKGIKVHPALQRFHMHDERMNPIWKTCVDLGFPIVAHSGPSSSGDQYAEPRAFADVLQAFPDLRVVLAHMGGGAWRQLAEIARAFQNAYFDCCEIIEWTGGPGAPTDRELAQLILDVGADRVMMGSDFPWYDIDHTVERVMELPLLATEQKEAILGANAVRILGL